MNRCRDAAVPVSPCRRAAFRVLPHVTGGAILLLGAAIGWGAHGGETPPASRPSPAAATAPASRPHDEPAGTADRPPRAPSTAPAVLYREDLQKTKVGEMPDDFLVLEGEFAVQEQDGNRFLELPGEPLSTFGLLFGPGESQDVAVSARFHGTRRGRRYPSFGAGLGGAAGYQLIVAGGKDAIELLEGEELRASTEFRWTSGAWTHLRLQIRKAGEGQWKVEAKAWQQGQPEPSGWMISHDAEEEPPSGRPSLWGTPYAGTPIRFDDLMLMRAGGGGAAHSTSRPVP